MQADPSIVICEHIMQNYSIVKLRFSVAIFSSYNNIILLTILFYKPIWLNANVYVTHQVKNLSYYDNKAVKKMKSKNMTLTKDMRKPS